jgi:oxidase EvaA
VFANLGEFTQWLDNFDATSNYSVQRAPLDTLKGWSSDPDTGDLVHDSRKFYAVRGLRVHTDHREIPKWSQPIIVQPEIGILGILAKVVDGQVYCLMQAKMEPGNVNVLQISPTVQATRSNYSRVHQGRAVPYLDDFLAPRAGNAIFDALQSEQGSWFLAKRNRNMIVQVADDLPVLPGFCWLSLDQIYELLTWENLINMDARTVLSGAPFILANSVARRGIGLRTTEEILSWFTEVKSRHTLERQVVPLADVPLWRRDEWRISHESGRFFSVIGVNVEASNREVGRWSQPMIEPCGRGVIAFVCRRIDGELHLLVHARTEAGTHDVVEMSPTVNCIPANYADTRTWPRYLDVVLSAPPERRLVDVVHSEEGGRFYHAENRYLAVEMEEDFELEPPDDYCWITPGQLQGFVRYGNHVNVAARCLLACLSGSLRIPAAVSNVTM